MDRTHMTTYGRRGGTGTSTAAHDAIYQASHHVGWTIFFSAFHTVLMSKSQNKMLIRVHVRHSGEL